MVGAERRAQSPTGLARAPQGAGAARPAAPAADGSRLAPYLLAYALLAVLWTWLVWGPAPQVIPNGDGGNVASIAAGWLDRARFAQDPVLATAQASRFYMALTVPLTMLLGRALGDIGSGYIVQIAPLLFLQLAGFHLLGLRLYRHAAFAAALALVSVPPIVVFSGELWGMLDTPLTRSFAGAALPWILLLLLGGARGVRPSPWVVMAACGATVYLHPVSAPAFATGCWLAMLADRPATVGWPAHLRRLVLAGLLFVAIALPFALVFANVVPGGAPASNATRAQVAATLHTAAGSVYYDVGIVVLMMRQTEWAWRWYVWGAGVAALVLVPLIDRDARRPALLLAAFLVGVLASSLGLAALDQWLAAAAGRQPLQLDLVRNVRFVVPILLLLAIWLASTVLAGRDPGALRRVAAFAAVLGFAGYWWHFHPTPVSRAAAAALGRAPAPAPRDPADARILTRIGELPPNSRMLPIATSRHGPIELLGLAIRYAAFQPVVFHEKDINLLSYSGSAGALDWARAMPDFVELRDAIPPRSDAILARILDRLRPDYLLVHDTTTPPHLLQSLLRAGPSVATEGPWRLIAASATARDRATAR